MDGTSRETRITTAFVAVADTLTTDFDVVDLLHTLVDHSTQILETDTGGLMLVDDSGDLQLMAATSEAAEFDEIMRVSAIDGPCFVCFTDAVGVSVPDIAVTADRWPAFAQLALAEGFHSVHAIPLKLRGQVIGTMNLFGLDVGALSERDASLAQALADVATIGILQERLAQEASVLRDQLHLALDSRIMIEQAKGVIAQSLGIGMNEAFTVLRTHARNNNLTIRFVAGEISGGKLLVHRVGEDISIVPTGF
jgi:GAF domain-containing protein